MFRNWSTLADGGLPARARDDGFAVLLATDRRTAREQAPLSVAVIALDDSSWSVLRPAVGEIAAAIRGIPKGSRQVLAIRE